MFITFEGGEGAGKSTQIAKTMAWLESLGYSVLLTREPGGTPLGQEIRRILLHSEEPIMATTEVLLFAADRAQHVTSVIRPALADGKIVLCDRYADSTLAYQGYGRGISTDQLMLINQIATCGLVPDLTLWLDVPVIIGRERASRVKQPDRMEADTQAFHERIREGFQELYRQYPERIVRIDASKTIEEVFGAIKSRLITRIT